MSASTAIGMVSESLRNLLVGEMTLRPRVKVTVLAPDEGGGNRRINLFLYKVQENPAFKTMDWQVKPGDPNQLVPPPLSLNLFYLMTPYAQNDTQTGNATAHVILGEAMRVFYENPVVPQAYLVPELQDARETIKIILNSLDLEELSQVWSTFTEPFRLSVLYEISVVQLDMLSESERTMAQRVRQIGVPQVQAPFRPPVVEDIQATEFNLILSAQGPSRSRTIDAVQEIRPELSRAEARNLVTSAPVQILGGVSREVLEAAKATLEAVGAAVAQDTIVTFYGRNLIGWRAYVTVMNRLILDAVEMTDDSFTATIPSDFPPGFHEIRVDISHLFRRVFFFEVTD